MAGHGRNKEPPIAATTAICAGYAVVEYQLALARQCRTIDAFYRCVLCFGVPSDEGFLVQPPEKEKATSTYRSA